MYLYVIKVTYFPTEVELNGLAICEITVAFWYFCHYDITEQDKDTLDVKLGNFSICHIKT